MSSSTVSSVLVVSRPVNAHLRLASFVPQNEGEKGAERRVKGYGNKVKGKGGGGGRGKHQSLTHTPAPIRSLPRLIDPPTTDTCRRKSEPETCCKTTWLGAEEGRTWSKEDSSSWSSTLVRGCTRQPRLLSAQ